MVKKLRKRVHRAATDDERSRHEQIRRQIEGELPEIRRRAKQKLKDIETRSIDIRHIVAALKQERLRQDLSLAEIKRRTGIDRSALSRLENTENANPTLNTLARYADAVGKQLLFLLAEAENG